MTTGPDQIQDLRRSGLRHHRFRRCWRGGDGQGAFHKRIPRRGPRARPLSQGISLRPRRTKSRFWREDLLTNHPEVQPNTFRKTPAEKSQTSARNCLRPLCRWHQPCTLPLTIGASMKLDFLERSKSRRDSRNRLCRTGPSPTDLEPYYTKVGMGSRCFGSGPRASPFDPPSFETLSHAAAPRKIWWRHFRNAPLTSSAGILIQRRWPISFAASGRERSPCVNCGFFAGALAVKSGQIQLARQQRHPHGRA